MKINIQLNDVDLNTAIALRRAIMFLSEGCRDNNSKVFQFSEKKLEALRLSNDIMYDLNDLDEKLKEEISNEFTTKSRATIDNGY